MKRLFAFLLCIASPALAQNSINSPSIELPNVAAVAVSSYGQYLHIQGATTPGDGGGGYFYRNGLVCAPDGVTILKDKSGNCFFKQPGGSAPGSAFIANIAAMQALGAASPTLGDVIVIDYGFGYGGGGNFHWVAGSSAATDVCMTFAATGVATGRWVRQLGGASLSLQMCGVTPDGATDNSTAMQAAFNALSTYNLGEIYCPAVAGIINFGSTLTPIGGGEFRGQANTYKPYLGDGTNTPGACHLKFTGASGWAIDYQTPFQSIAPCPSAVAPRFYNFTLETSSTANGIRLNNSATAGFSDDCVATGGGQSVLFGAVFDGIVTSSGARGTTGIQVNKSFDTSIINGVYSGWDTQVDIEGSDNVLTWNNKFNFATLRELDIQSRGTFGNFDTVRDNQFFTPYFNALDFLRSSARSGVIDSNYFEADFTGITNVLNITCGLDQTITNNAMELIPANVAYWLQVTGNCINLTLTNNYGGGNLPVPAKWNSGAGAHWVANTTKQQIIAWGNQDNNAYVPFVTASPSPKLNDNPPTGSGAILGIFDASSNDSINGNYGPTIYIGPTGHSGDFEFQPQNAPNGHVSFQMRPVVSGTIDLWILAYTGAGSNQQYTCTIGGGGAVTFTLTSGTTSTWYSPAGFKNVAVADPVIDCYNNDTTHGQFVYVTRWVAVLH